MEAVGTGLFILGAGIYVIGSIWLLVEAFKQSVLWGLGSLLLPFMGLIFVAVHWKAAKRPFLIGLAGLGIMIPGMLLAMAYGPEGVGPIQGP